MPLLTRVFFRVQPLQQVDPSLGDGQLADAFKSFLQSTPDAICQAGSALLFNIRHAGEHLPICAVPYCGL